MTHDLTERLSDQFDALNTERARTWAPATFAQNVAQRRALVEAFDPAAVVGVGDSLAPFELIDSAGGTLSLDALIANSPALLLFFRFEGCPACNIALPYYDRQLRPALAEAGIALVAVSPQLPDQVGGIRTRHDLGFRVASDPGNRLGRRLGITFGADIPAPEGIGALTGTGTAELPQPAAILIDRDRTVRFVSVSPDWLRRPEADEILTAVEALKLRQAA